MGLALLIGLVIVGHWRLVDEVQSRLADLQDEAAMPPHMQVSFVRELHESAPAVAHPAARPAERQLAALGPGLAASAASAPEGVEAVEAIEPLVAATSASAAGLNASLPPAAAASAATDEPASPEWPASTRLSYALTGNYRGEVYGQGQVEWLRHGRQYQVNVDVKVGPWISRTMSSSGVLGPDGMTPQRFDSDTKILFREPRRVTVLLGPGTVTLNNGRTEAAPRGVQDASSQFVQLTWLFLTGREHASVGHRFQLALALPQRQYWVTYEVVGEETLASPMGLLDTWHIKPTQDIGGGDLTAEVWLAPTLEYLPVRLRIKQDEQNYIDLMLKAPPLQAAPEPIVGESKKESP